ncbi:MAG: hypothetical protein WCO56_22445 [Verrucomicrobiota bacterium]
MRASPLRATLAEAGAVFQERHGVEVAARFAGPKVEYHAIRDAVGLTDFSFLRAFRLPEDKAIDFLDGLLGGNVAKIRFGRVLHTCLLDREGMLLADCLVANNDQEFVFLCESAVPDAELDAVLQLYQPAQAGLEDLAASHAVLSVDGFRAWEVVKKLFGADVLGLPYMSVENYTFQGQPIRLFRAGKTSEFGYLLLVPQTVAAVLFDTLKAEVQALGGALCGVEVHDALRLEGRFFNIQQEGRLVRDPLPLGLQWMFDFDKDTFLGAEAIKQRRTDGLRRKIIGVSAAPGCEGLQAGARLYHQGQPVAEVVTTCHSYVLGRQLGLAIFPAELAYSGLTFRLGSAAGPVVQSISMPPIMPKSLTVKLDEL